MKIKFLQCICMVRDDLKEFVKTIPSSVTIVAATKYLSSEEMIPLLDAGINNFGENRVEPFLEKYEALKGRNIVWHFIGHLQRNKAKKIIDKINYLQSLDSLELATLIDKSRKTPLKCFVEVSINLELNKNGVPYFEAIDFVKKCLEFKNIEIVGLMMMGIAGASEELMHDQFGRLRDLKEEIQDELKIKIPYLSMGMTDDYKIAIEEGSTHLRLGRVLLK